MGAPRKGDPEGDYRQLWILWRKGGRVAESVGLGVPGAMPAAAGSGEGAGVSVTIGKQRGRFPAIGLGVPAAETAHALEVGALVKRIGAQWLVCEVDLRKDPGKPELAAHRGPAELTGRGEDALVTRERQRAALVRCTAELQSAAETSDTVLRAEALRQAMQALGQLTGRVSAESVLDIVFARFCIGK